ncbi:hypothetical protein [Pseudoxanthomonas sp.]|uniref:hypothetical protein n=1 Tax=Pseudoxanthomonas sp. TaxID=1871049 RepID=UPI0026386A4E|nr:hypothetical protein [Pseudoxanthomonas sp.]WDS35852.1 MAG: hypothetical protein O8I58_16275 [Pseudoxanthomonas sp.]
MVWIDPDFVSQLRLPPVNAGRPAWTYWKNLAYVAAKDAVFLSFNIDPLRLELPDPGTELWERWEFVRSHISAGTLRAEDASRSGDKRLIKAVVLCEFRTWGESLPVPFLFPDEFPGVKVGDVRSHEYELPSRLEASAPIRAEESAALAQPQQRARMPGRLIDLALKGIGCAASKSTVVEVTDHLRSWDAAKAREHGLRIEGGGLLYFHQDGNFRPLTSKQVADALTNRRKAERRTDER